MFGGGGGVGLGGGVRMDVNEELKFCENLNQRTNGPVNAHLISGPTVSTKKKQILTSSKGRNSVANL